MPENAAIFLTPGATSSRPIGILPVALIWVLQGVLTLQEGCCPYSRSDFIILAFLTALPR